jgi:hypothetical protein
LVRSSRRMSVTNIFSSTIVGSISTQLLRYISW